MAYVYRADVTIAASPDEVWAVLADLPGYLWNPFTPVVRGELIVGRTVTLHVVLRPGRLVAQRERVLEVTPGRALAWGVVDPPRWLLHAERRQTLEPVAGGTRYVSVDAISGLLAPLVHLLHGAGIQRGFDAMAAALQTRVELGSAR